MPTGDELLKRIDAANFPAAPVVLTRLSHLLTEEWVTGEQLAEVMALDAGIAARVLRLANSVHFRGKGVKSIPEAVLRVGCDGVRDIVFALSAMRSLRPAQFDSRLFWRHSLAVAQATQVLQRRALNLPAPLPEGYAGGLLHDIGMVALDRALGSDYRPVLEAARTSGRPSHEVERERLGTDHAEVGGRLLELWRLPSALVTAVRAHHDPLGEDQLAAGLVHLADFVCNHHGLHHGTGYKPESAVAEIWDELGVGEAELPALTAALEQELGKADALLAEG